MKRCQLPDDIQQILDDSGVPWHVDYGTKHLKVVIRGKLVGILPYGTGRGQRAGLNVRAQIRRAIRDYNNGR